MSTAFARAEARLGASVRARLGNASASIAGSPSIGGIFSSRPVLAGVGPMGIQAREFELVCQSAEAGMVVEDMPVAVTYAGTVLSLAVAESTIDPHLGNTTILLKRAP